MPPARALLMHIACFSQYMDLTIQTHIQFILLWCMTTGATARESLTRLTHAAQQIKDHVDPCHCMRCEDPMCKPRLESSAQVDMTEN